MIVPGFNHRFPKEGDDDYLWSFADCHARPDPLIETCCTTLDAALAAQSRGAGRIELCTDLSAGGFTPPRDLIREVVNQLSIPVNVLIRPSARDNSAGVVPSETRSHPRLVRGRGPCVAWEGSSEARRFQREPQSASRAEDYGFSAEDFVYNESDLEQMVEEIEYCKTVGAAGIVVGALTPEGIVDLPAMRRLIVAARPLSVTFHRAFDVCTEDPFTALDKIIALGCDRLLTSGQAPAAWEGRGRLRLLVRRASGRRVVMPGGGVTPDNLSDLAAFTLAREFHGTRIP